MSKNHVLYAESETGEFVELCEFKPINWNQINRGEAVFNSLQEVHLNDCNAWGEDRVIVGEGGVVDIYIAIYGPTVWFVVDFEDGRRSEAINSQYVVWVKERK